MRVRAGLVLALALAFAAAPLVVPFDGFEPERFPRPQADAPLEPAGWAFSIWGVIYLWLVASAVFGLLRRPGDPGWDAARGPLIISLAVGVPWLWVAERSPLAATAMIVVMLAGAVAALLRAGPADRWLLAAPLGLYAGWLTAATGVSLAATLAGYGLTGPAPAAWIGLAAALGAAALVLSRTPAPEYAVAVAWALLAVILNDADAPAVLWASGAGIALVAALAGRAALRPA